MSDTMHPEVSGFLGRFFAAPNQLMQDSKPEIRTWVERLAGAEMLPTVLPCWRAGKLVDWYGLAFDDRQLSSLGESLTAFVGPTYTTFRGQIAHLDLADPIDQAVNNLTRGAPTSSGEQTPPRSGRRWSGCARYGSGAGRASGPHRRPWAACCATSTWPSAPGMRRVPRSV